MKFSIMRFFILEYDSKRIFVIRITLVQNNETTVTLQQWELTEEVKLQIDGKDTF